MSRFNSYYDRIEYESPCYLQYQLQSNTIQTMGSPNSWNFLSLYLLHWKSRDSHFHPLNYQECQHTLIYSLALLIISPFVLNLIIYVSICPGGLFAPVIKSFLVENAIALLILGSVVIDSIWAKSSDHVLSNCVILMLHPLAKMPVLKNRYGHTLCT